MARLGRIKVGTTLRPDTVRWLAREAKARRVRQCDLIEAAIDEYREESKRQSESSK